MNCRVQIPGIALGAVSPQRIICTRMVFTSAILGFTIGVIRLSIFINLFTIRIAITVGVRVVRVSAMYIYFLLIRQAVTIRILPCLKDFYGLVIYGRCKKTCLYPQVTRRGNIGKIGEFQT